VSGIVSQPALADLPRVARTGTTVGTNTVNTAAIVDLAVTNAKLSVNASDQGKHGLWVPANFMRPTVSNGCAALVDVETTAGRPDQQVLDFDGSADEFAQFDFALGNSWNVSTFTFQAYYTHLTAVTTDVAWALQTDVAWALQGVSVANDETIDVVYGTAVVVVDTLLNAAEDEHITAESSAVTLGGTVAALNHLYFRFFRDVSADDTSTDARFIGLILFLTTDAGTDA